MKRENKLTPLKLTSFITKSTNAKQVIGGDPTQNGATDTVCLFKF